MIRTILESADHAERVAKTIVPSKWLRHTLKIRFAEKIHIFLPSYPYNFSQCDLIMPKKFLFLSPLALCFFGHYNLVCCPREILHTILELACHLKKYLFCA